MALRFVGVKNKEFRYLHCILTWIVSDFQKKTLHVKIERKGEMKQLRVSGHLSPSFLISKSKRELGGVCVY